MTNQEIFAYAIAWLCLGIALVSQRAAYRNGVSDGAYNQWLPHVRKIIKEDSKFPPPGWKEPTP